MKNPLTEEYITQFVSKILSIPAYSAAHPEARLAHDTRVLVYEDGYYAVRVFPILTESSVQLIKDAYREEVERMVADGAMDLVQQLPISLEDMTAQTARDITPASVWLLQDVAVKQGQIAEHKLMAMRYTTDVVTRFPCISMTYFGQGSSCALPGIEVYLIGTLLTPKIDALLRTIQAAERQRVTTTTERIVSA